MRPTLAEIKHWQQSNFVLCQFVSKSSLTLYYSTERCWYCWM